MISSCGAPNRQAYGIQWMKDNVTFAKHPNYEGGRSSDPMNKYLKGFNANPTKPEGEAGCVMVELHPWKKHIDKDFRNFGVDYWDRSWSWEELDSPITTSNGIGLDSSTHEYLVENRCSHENVKCPPERSSTYITRRKAEDPKKSDYWGEFIYIGPWKFVPKIGKEIRLVATQGKIYGGIRSFFESKTPENSLIPEMPEIKLARSPEMNLDYCKVLWAKTYGYNAVADLKRNPWWPWFSRNFYRGTGKIIDATE